MAGQYHDHGYDLAQDDLAARAARKPGHAPVVSPVGEVATVINLKAVVDMFEAA